MVISFETMLENSQNSIYVANTAKQSKQRRILSWKEFGIVIADQNQNITAADCANDMKQCTKDPSKCCQWVPKNGAHFFGQPYYNLDCNLEEEHAMLYTANTALQTSRLSSETIRVFISMNFIQLVSRWNGWDSFAVTSNCFVNQITSELSRQINVCTSYDAFWIWITFNVIWLLWCQHIRLREWHSQAAAVPFFCFNDSPD